MACKKSELVSAINSFAAARASGDGNLLQFSSQLLSQFVETIDFDPEEVVEAEEKLETKN